MSSRISCQVFTWSKMNERTQPIIVIYEQYSSFTLYPILFSIFFLPSTCILALPTFPKFSHADLSSSIHSIQFNQILDNNPALYFQLQQQRLIELIRQKKIDEALVFAQEELAPRGEEHPEFLEELEQTMTLLAYDIDLSVIEARYRASLNNTTSSSGELVGTNGGGEGNNDEALDGIDGVPSSIAFLLHPAHRQSTATKVNAAILKSQSHGSTPKLPNLLKILAWGEELLSNKLDFPKMDLLVNNPKESASLSSDNKGEQNGNSNDVAML